MVTGIFLLWKSKELFGKPTSQPKYKLFVFFGTFSDRYW